MQSGKPTYGDLQKRIRELETSLEQHMRNEENSEAQFRILVENVPAPILILVDWTFAYVNKAALILYGAANASQIVGTPILDRVHPDFIETVKGRIEAMNDKRYVAERVEHIHLKLDGTPMEAEVFAVPFNYLGKPGALVFVRDITELKKTFAEIKEKNLFIQTVLDHLPIGIALNTISDGSTIYVNEKFSEIYGWPAKEMKDVGTFFENVYPDPVYRQEIMTRIMADLHSGIAANMHWENIRVTHKDGSYRFINAVNIPLTGQNTMVSTVIDITGLKEAENMLRNALEKANESDCLKTAFLQNMSHEIRTPMNAICGFSEMLNDATLSPEKRRDFTEIIINSSSQLLSIVNDILSISTIETGQAKVNLKMASVNSILQELLAMFKPRAQNQQIVLLTAPDLPDQSAEIRTDETKLRQILTNLIGNALKFTLDGFVEFGYRVKGDMLEFFVKDTGIGLPEEQHGNIFERFRQGENITARTFGGTGLGLSISKSYVELMGGTIWLTSEPGHGSTFYFTIPYLPAGVAEGREEAQKPETSAGIILIAEDEEYNYMFLRELLSKTKAELMYARNGREAVDLCRKYDTITMVIMDLKMPVMDGYEATREIRGFRPNLPVVAHTAYALPSELEEMGGNYFTDYLEKPVMSHRLFEIVNKYLK
jgi:two-component system, chemotaxis family, CheB/CheR fusion protein